MLIMFIFSRNNHAPCSFPGRQLGRISAREDYGLTCNYYRRQPEAVTVGGVKAELQEDLPEMCQREMPPFIADPEPKAQIVSGVYLNRCDCTHRNGLQEDCRMTRCQRSRHLCLTQPFPSCRPSGAFQGYCGCKSC